MEIMEVVLLILLVVVCVSLGALVLIQQGRGSDIGAAFGSGAANTIFGSTGATPFLVKFTAMLAIGFFAVTFALAFTAKEKSKNEQEYDFGDIPQATQDDSLDELFVPPDEDLLPPDDQDADSAPEDGDQLPSDTESDDAGDVLDNILEDIDTGDSLPTPEEESEEGDTLPDL